MSRISDLPLPTTPLNGPFRPCNRERTAAAGCARPACPDAARIRQTACPPHARI